jgi:hypothetical protein
LFLEREWGRVGVAREALRVKREREKERKREREKG